MNTGFGHAAIRASAGSGKTFVLSHRYIGLLARGVPVERITALTFSRKAAREIFEAVIAHLCEAALSDEGAREAARHTGVSIGREGYRKVLCRLLENLHQVRVGTLDSFIVGVLRMFPEHYSIPPDFSLFDGGGEDARRIHGQALDGILAGDKRREGFFQQAFRAATTGRHEKGLERVLEEKLMGGQETYRLARDCALWGRPERIWPRGTPWLAGGADPHETAAVIMGLPDVTGLEEKARRRWEAFTAAAANWVYGHAWSAGFDYLYAKLAAVRDELENGSAEIVLERKRFDLDGKLATAALALVRYVAAAEIGGALERTRGLCRLLAAYEEEYGKVVRRDGRISFADAVDLVSGQGPGKPSLKRSGADRLYIEYRLDARLDHWLIDEFQDTSRKQWAVFSNLADEVLQSGDERSFFIVGDAKQAIYGWRGGDAALLGEIIDRYAGEIEDLDLVRSYRSCRPVIAMVNSVFGAVGGMGLPPATVEAWQAIWRDHSSSAEVVPADGLAVVLEAGREDGAAPGPEDRYRVVKGILLETVARRGDLTAGILVRTNERARRISEYLRRACPSLAIECDGPSAILDSFAVALILSLVRLAFHPGDRSARMHLAMSPLASDVTGAGGGGSVSVALLRQIREKGFPSFVAYWAREIGKASALDGFEKLRLGQLEDAANRFASAGGREGDDFCSFVDGIRLNESSAGAAVRIMTVHQSKGLDFDVVVLPDLQDWGSMNKARADDLTICRDGDGVRWIVKTPRRVVAECDETLRAVGKKKDAESSLEDLCVLYVAMTRARAGLYVVTSPPGRNSRALTPAAFVKKALARESVQERTVSIGGEKCLALYELGARDWCRGRARTSAEPREVPRSERRTASPIKFGEGGLERVLPSSREDTVFDAEWLFDVSSRRALDLGDAVHALFERVSWLAETDWLEMADRWREESRLPENICDEAVEQFRTSLESPPVREALEAAGPGVMLWREKSFDVVEGGRWLSGVFDRVEIFSDGGGRIAAARITDYKSDHVEGGAGSERAARRYEPQMEIYGEALSILLGLGREKVGLRLIFTACGVVYDIREVSVGGRGGGRKAKNNPEEEPQT